MKILKIIGFVLLGLILLVVIYGLILPSTAHIERSIVIDAPSEVIYNEIDGFKTFGEYAVWASRDTAMDVTLSGPSFGVGAKYEWKSEKDDVGNGWIEIVEAEPYQMIRSKMSFDGYDGVPEAIWKLEETDEGTLTTYIYHEEGVGLISRIVFSFIKGMLVDDYDVTLQNLKSRVEGLPDFGAEIVRDKVEAEKYLGYKTSCPADNDMIELAMSEGYGKLFSFVNQNAMQMAGYPLAVYTSHTADEIQMILGFPLEGDASFESDEITVEELPGGFAVRAVHAGDYANLARTHAIVDRYVAFYKLEVVGPPWEVYLNSPDQVQKDELVTHVYYPVK